MTGKSRDRDGRRTTFGNVGSKAACWCASTLLVVIGLGACTSGDAHPSATSDRPSVSTNSMTATAPSTTPSSDRESEDRSAVEQTYVHFWRTVDTIQTSGIPQSQWPAELQKVAVDPIYMQSLNSLVGMLKFGKRFYGATVVRPADWSIKSIGGTASAVFKVCLDTSHEGAMRISDGAHLSVGKPRVATQNYAVRGGDGVWRISQVEYLKDGAC